MKVKVTFDNGKVVEAESFYLLFALEEVARLSGIMDEDEVLKILSKEEQQILN